MNVMASQKHLDLLSSGKTLWNKWRQEYADEQALEPDLSEADPDTFDRPEAERNEVRA